MFVNRIFQRIYIGYICESDDFFIRITVIYHIHTFLIYKGLTIFTLPCIECCIEIKSTVQILIDNSRIPVIRLACVIYFIVKLEKSLIWNIC